MTKAQWMHQRSLEGKNQTTIIMQQVEQERDVLRKEYERLGQDGVQVRAEQWYNDAIKGLESCAKRGHFSSAYCPWTYFPEYLDLDRQTLKLVEERLKSEGFETKFEERHQEWVDEDSCLLLIIRWEHAIA